MIQSNGDYRTEAHLETLIGGPLYAHQRNLPRLPIPDLRDTIERFLPTALPLAQSSQEKENLLASAKIFEQQATGLQQCLIQRRDEWGDSSWLQSWWNSYIYLEVRDPLPVNVSYFFHFSDDPSLPLDETHLSVYRGAAILHAIASFRKKVCTGTLTAEKVRHSYICSAAFKYMFHASRIPQLQKDAYRIYDPSRHGHVIVACRGYFFTFDFVDSSGDVMESSKIETFLQECILRAQHLDSLPESSRPPKLGWLTSSERDFWAQARTELLNKGGPSVLTDLTTLESGSILLCLDDEEVRSNPVIKRIHTHTHTYTHIVVGF